MQENSVDRMGDAPIGRLLFHYSLPAVAGFLANGAYQIIDRAMVGRGIGTDAMAAVTAAFPVSIVAMAVGLLVGAGTANKLSVLLGQRDHDGAERILGQSVRMSVRNGVLLAAVTWLATEPILLACACPADLLPMAVPFVRILAIGQVFLIVLLSMGNILRVVGRPVLGLCIFAGSQVLNAIFAAAAIYVLHWGVSGVALATALAQVAGCLAVLTVVQRGGSPIRIRWRYLRADAEARTAVLKLGLPVGVMQILGMLVFVAANHGAQLAGNTGVAALGALNTIAMFLMFPTLGVVQAMQPLVGFNMGAGNIRRVRSLLWRVLLITALMGMFFSLVVTFFAGPIATMFTKDPAFIALVRPGLPWFVVPLLLFGASATMSHYFLSVHRPMRSAALLLGRQLLAIPLFLLLPRWLGFKGMYIVSVFADLPFALVALAMARAELRRLRLAGDAPAQHAPAVA